MNRSLVHTHSIVAFNPPGVIAAAGLVVSPLNIAFMLGEVSTIIYQQLKISAFTLNEQLKEEFLKAMYDIHEYSNSPIYMEVLESAFARNGHTGVYIDESGLYQAKYIDLRLLGDLADLQRIQNRVRDYAGTLEGFTGMYIAFLQGRDKNDTYSRLTDAKCSLMIDEEIAPFWELIEWGNSQPVVGFQSKHLLRSFGHTYKKEMLRAFERSVVLARLLALINVTIGFAQTEAAVMTIDDRRHLGYQWKSKKGNMVFVIAGSEKVVKFGSMNVLMGRGAIFDRLGNLIRRFTGRIPK